MSNIARVAGQAANTLSKPLDIDDVFSTYLYDGTSASHTITNGLDLGGEGGLVWIKKRNESTNSDHMLYDTERGPNERLFSNDAGRSYTRTDQLNSFDSDGFTLGADSPASPNNSGKEYVSWSFRKAPKFFDVVTYTGNGTAGRTVSHNLGTTVGSIFVKRTDATRNWAVYHRSLGATKYLALNETNAENTATSRWNDTEPTSTVFTVGSAIDTNVSGGTYVAYLFAHNDGDGDFGDGSQDIIKCGSYTGNGSTDGPEIDLGFEPQWMLTKRTDGSGFWNLVDVFRGWTADGNWKFLRADGSDAEADGSSNTYALNSTGFKVTSTSSSYNASGGNYIYMAIRRGPLSVPTDATKVFAIDDTPVNATTSTAVFSSGFPVDLGINKRRDGGSNGDTYLGTRLLGSTFLVASKTDAETANGSFKATGYQDGFGYYNGSGLSAVGWMWKRAPGYFDAVAYTANQTAGLQINHNLSVVPEMIWVKSRNATTPWAVYHKDIGNTKSLRLNDTNASATENFWNGTTPNADTFTLGANSEVNYPSGRLYIAYLFASVPGVSKVGSVSHTSGSATNVDCGFTSGARFIILKRYDAVSDWWVFDTARGIVAGNDARLILNQPYAETSTDQIDPLSSGFTIDGNRATGDYIFYAIA